MAFSIFVIGAGTVMAGCIEMLFASGRKTVFLVPHIESYGQWLR